VVVPIVAVVAVLAAASAVKNYVADAYYIPSVSMLPGLHVNDRVVVSRLAYDLHPVHRGDIVVFDAPPGVLPPPAPPNLVRRIGADIGLVDTTGVLIKRVIGLPGDTVEGRDGRVLIDGELLLEPYLAPGTLTSDFGPVRVPAGHLWVMGDNRGDSEDSRIFGPVPESSVVGEAVYRVWPPDRLAFLVVRPPVAAAGPTMVP
jgi:signal peptidase I